MRKQTYNCIVQVRVPQTLVNLVEATADRLMTSGAEYVRRAIAAQLQKDGAIPENK